MLETRERVKILLYDYRENIVGEANVDPEESERTEEIRSEYAKYFYAARIVSYIGNREGETEIRRPERWA